MLFIHTNRDVTSGLQFLSTQQGHLQHSYSLNRVIFPLASCLSKNRGDDIMPVMFCL